MIEEDYQRTVVREHEKVMHNQSYFYKLIHTFYDEDQCFERHWHNSIEINYSVDGIAIQEIDHQKIVMETGDMMLINSRVLHEICVTSPLEGIALFIDRKYIDYNCPNAKDKSFNLNLNLKAKKQVENLLLKLVDTYESGNRIRSHIIVLEIIEILTTQLMEEREYKKGKQDEQYSLATSIIKYIDHNYAHKISLDELATLFNYNNTYISTVFKKKLGITILEYLQNIRMQHVLDDLLLSKDPIVDIALNNGFANIQVFNNKFKKLYGMTQKSIEINSKKTITLIRKNNNNLHQDSGILFLGGK